MRQKRTRKPPPIFTHEDQITARNCPLIIRTDFEYQERWEQLYESILASYAAPHIPAVQFLADITYRDRSVEELLTALPSHYQPLFFFVVDHGTLQSPELPVLVVDRGREPGRTFRTLPSELASIAANLSIANLDFYEFADFADKHGVFRGFPQRNSKQDRQRPID